MSDNPIHDSLNDQLIRGSGGGGCFPAGTVVHTPTGLVPIEDIKPNQSILAFDSDCRVVETTVAKTFKHENNKLINVHYWGDYVTTTLNHWFYIDDTKAFQYAGKLLKDNPLRDINGAIRPVERLELCNRTETVYNLTVETYHTFIVGEHGIFVHNGGGGKSSSPSEAEVTALSRATVKISELVSEGPIEGFKPGKDPRESIFLDDTPVRNSDGSMNFTNYAYVFRPGTQFQAHIPGYGDAIGNETSVGQDVTATFPVTRQIINNQIDAIRTRIGFQLQEFEDDGDVSGASINFTVQIKEGNGAFVTRTTQTINARFETLTEYDYYFPVNNVGGTIDSFTVRISSNAPDETTIKLQRVVRWQSYTEVIETKLSYPHSAIIAQSFAAEQFSSIPKRAYFLGGMRCRIPTNAVVESDGGLVFSGVWDMNLYRPAQAVSDPTWQLLELLTNKRFGLGNRITIGEISLASLYEISRHNNQLINDGFGGTERRYRFNSVMQSGEDAHDQIQLLLNCCNAHYYWDGNRIHFWQDRPIDPVSQVNNAIVVNGTFNYSSTDIRSRNSICSVVWNDPDNQYKRAVESVSIREAIDKYGIRETSFTATGATSRGQAVRAGRRKIYTDLYETETVTFSMPVFGIKFRPGDVIKVFDWKKTNLRYSGVVVSGNRSDITLDSPVILPSGGTFDLELVLPIGGQLQLQTKQIANSPGTYTVISVTSPFSVAPVPGSVWSINVVIPKLFRVLGMQAKSDSKSIVEIVAGEYYDQKQNLVENGFALTPYVQPITIPNVVPTPQSVNLTDLYINNQTTLEISWVEPVDDNGNRDLFVSSYQYQTKRGNGNWSEIRTAIGVTQARVENIQPGTYYARVATVYISGGTSVWKDSQPYIVSDSNLYFNYRRPKSAIALF